MRVRFTIRPEGGQVNVKLLPIHPQPRDGEILSSWMVRLSLENRFHLHTFYSKLLGYKHQIWTRDVDRSATSELIQLLSDCSSCPIEKIEATTLRHYDGLMYEDVRLHGVARWIVPLGIYHRLHRRGMQCCPACLKDEIPYYCLKWRTSFFTICEKHRCFLIDECPNCGAKVEYHRLGIGKYSDAGVRDLKLCSQCYFDLSTAPLRYPQRLPEHVVQEYRNTLKHIAKNHWSKMLNFPTAHPIAFFQGLRGLLMLVNKRSAIQLRKNINESIPLNLPLEKEWSLEFGFLEIQERFNLLMACFWLMHDWPERFVHVLKISRLSRSRFYEDVEQFPFWLLQPLNDHLDQRHYIPSSDEVKSVVAHLNSKGIFVNSPSVAKALSISIDFARRYSAIWEKDN
jgi:hypothetical protein